MLSKAELNAIKERAEKATPGPWSFDGDFTARINGILEPVIYAGYGELVVRDEDVDFITSAHTDITKLVAEVEHLQELKKLYEEILEWYAHPETYKRAGNGEYVIMTDKGWNAKWALNKRLKGYSD